ncbi:hypothetical protein SAMD00023353_3300390 [Rosellinia necatrix]|uniref:Uncharacterized protein n=1 Tax=Rosellinia necatrix TaxID=77044 RepID=A0A1S8A972_ROSNE|nr:hypothetical protein SAMD00023353_3300390 [Rosellinia necatrix]
MDENNSRTMADSSTIASRHVKEAVGDFNKSTATGDPVTVSRSRHEALKPSLAEGLARLDSDASKPSTLESYMTAKNGGGDPVTALGMRNETIESSVSARSAEATQNLTNVKRLGLETVK